jgi:sporulation protein YlmC with PRC-barrel domain
VTQTVAEVHLEDLLGRRVRATNGRVVGRIEEIRAERHGDQHEVTEILIGPGALLERLAVVNWLLSRRPQLRIARWNQIVLDPVQDARLTCAVSELKEDDGRP